MHAARRGTFLAPVHGRSRMAQRRRMRHVLWRKRWKTTMCPHCTPAETQKIKSSRTEPIWIHPKVNRCQPQMELDTGSALTILPARMFHEHFDLPLQPTSTMLKPYAGDRLFVHTCVTMARSFEADTYGVDSD